MSAYIKNRDCLVTALIPIDISDMRELECKKEAGLQLTYMSEHNTGMQAIHNNTLRPPITDAPTCGEARHPDGSLLIGMPSAELSIYQPRLSQALRSRGGSVNHEAP